MNVWEIYQWINFRANKDQSGRSYTPEQFNLGLKACDIEFLKWKYGLPEEYQPGRPLPRQAWELTQKITDDLRHLKVYMGGRDHPLLKVDSDGFADIPSDYIHQSSLRFDSTVNGPDCSVTEEGSVVIEVLNDANFDARISSKVRIPTLKYPVCRLEDTYIEFRPKNLKFVVFTYLRMPTPGVLGYTIDDNNDIVYNPATSTQIEWPTDMHTDFANLLFGWLGENLKEPLVIQQAQQRKNQGI